MTALEIDSGERGASPEFAEPSPPPLPESQGEARPSDRSAGLTCLATFLAVAAAGWMVAGVFQGDLPRLVGVLGAVIGVGTIALSFRARQRRIVQLLPIPLAIVIGALLVLPFAKGSTSLPGLVNQALTSGGLSQPPVPFDPGWRFILLVLIAVVGAAAATLATGLARPKLGFVLPAPLVFAAALVQPQGATFLSTVVALVLLAASFAVAYGVDLAKDGTSPGGSFELRRFGKGAAVVGALVAAIVVLSQAGFLFPKPTDQQVIPPKRPQVPPPTPDRVLFTYRSPVQIPIRLGVLDVYRTVAWLTPPYDASRLQKVSDSGTIVPGSKPGDVRPGEMPALAPTRAAPVQVTFDVSNLTGHILPDVQNPVRVLHHGYTLDIDPRTQQLRLPNTEAQSGMTYTVVSAPSPNAAQLNLAPPPPASMNEYLQVPPAPPAVAALLARAPGNRFDRLQFVRSAYYQKVVAAGAGNPVDVPPSRVQQMLEGQDATPYEITAGEVLIARWAGIPARMGYGYYGGDRIGTTDQFSVRPGNGATWLEVYFDHYGWVPIVGIPPKARASITPDKKHQDPTIRPTDDLALLVYVPIRETTFQQLYLLVRYWGLRALPWTAFFVLVLTLYPGVVKAVRRRRRRQWALDRGDRQRIAVAYAEFRDVASDFNVGTLTMTPLEFLSATAEDAEHKELAWLVTRALWGDLLRDIHGADVDSAAEMASSLTKRMRRAAGGLSRLIALGSRASLRQPYSTDIPNLWPQLHVRARLRIQAARLAPAFRARRWVLAPIALVTAAILIGGTLAVLGGGTSRRSARRGAPIAAQTVAAVDLPARLAPATLDGVIIKPEPAATHDIAAAGHSALVADGEIFSIHDGSTIQGSLQVEGFKPGLRSRQLAVRQGVLQSLGNNQFQLVRFGGQRIYDLELADQRMLLWFPPTGQYMDLLVVRPAFDGADDLFVRVIDYQLGVAASRPAASSAPPPDPRRVTND